MQKTHNQKWFIKTRGSYLPTRWQGWFTYIPYAGYLVGPLILVLHNHSDFWTALFIVIPNWIAAVAIMQWVAVRKS